MTFSPYAKMAFAVNSMPKIRDTSFGLYRRLIIVPFACRIEKPDLELSKRIMQERDGIFQWAIRGLKRLRAHGGKFTETPETLLALEAYKEWNSPVTEFLLRMYEPAALEGKGYAVEIPLASLYGEYATFCVQNGYQRKSKGSVVAEIESLTHQHLSAVKLVKREDGEIMVMGLRLRATITGFVTATRTGHSLF